MPLPTSSQPVLLLGPLLRHVDPVSATVWVETDRACTVEVLGRQAAEVFQSSIISWSSKIIEDGIVDSSQRTWGSLQDSA